MDPDVITYERSVYNIVEFISDAGGLASACLILLQGLVMLFRYRELEWYMVSKLFTKK